MKKDRLWHCCRCQTKVHLFPPLIAFGKGLWKEREREKDTKPFRHMCTTGVSTLYLLIRQQPPQQLLLPAKPAAKIRDFLERQLVLQLRETHWQDFFSKKRRVLVLLRAHLHIASKMQSSKLHRRFIKIFVVMHEFFDESFDDSYFKLILIFEKNAKGTFHRKIRAWPRKIRWSFDETSMTAFSLLCVNGPLPYSTQIFA